MAQVEQPAGPKEARKLINQFANDKPTDQPNRTAWVEQQLEHQLLMAKVETRLVSHWTGSGAQLLERRGQARSSACAKNP